jgi:gentisate 1,2-dioxygenase
MQPKVAPAVASARQNFYSKIDEQNYAALWNVLSDIITPEPKSACIPYMWRFAEAKNYILEAGNLITAAEAERRVLILENPGLRGKSSITTSLYAGIQLVMPGEIAPAHRHSQSAVRLVLEAGPGAYTAVNGERTKMHYGDFILTPPNHWHDHGNTGADPVIWLDGLDIPMISHFDTSFIDHHNEDAQPITKKEGDSGARYGANMLPVDFKPGELASPIFNYPYARSREALEAMRRQNEWDPCHGLKMRFVNPADGGYAMPTVAAFMQLLPKGFKTAAYRSTDATVFVPIEGRGRTTIDGKTFEWGPKDVIVAPSWKWTSHEVDEDAVLFSLSDRVAQEKLGLWRQDRGNAKDAR